MRKYWEFWKDDEKLRVYTLRIAFFETIALVTISLLFLITLFKYYLSPKPVYVVSTGVNGVVVPSNYEGTVMYNFVSNYLNLIYTYNPNNFQDRTKEAENLAMPSMYQSIERYAKGVENNFKTQNYSSSIVFTTKDVKITQTSKNTYLFNIKHATITNFYDSLTNTQDVGFTITVVKGLASQENPYGIYIDSVTLIQNNGGGH